MSSKPPSRKRTLTAEEAELWAAAMRDAKQHRRRSTRDHPLSSTEKKPRDVSALSGNTPVNVPSPASSASPAPPPINTFDHRHKRKLSRNMETIDGRIDLHGMRQSEAFPALRRFLFACASRGDRNVLVITGKGTRAEIERMRDFTVEERGVLRRLVPQWLGEPELRSLVISYTTAGPRHGGDGALYVRLRKLKRD